MISSKPRLKVFIYVILLEKLTQLIGSNLFKDFRQEGEVGYWRRGLITASLKDCGTYSDDNERWIVFSNVLSIRGRISLSNFVGMGSKI